LTEAVRLKAEIDEAARGLEGSYKQMLRRVKKLKDRLNALGEETIRGDVVSEVVNREKALDSAWESLSRLSDSLISESKEAWQAYARLERKCKSSRSRLARLDDVRVSCRKIEAIASDMLCFTLGRSKRAAKQST
jgi:chromosome segregation ATPase